MRETPATDPIHVSLYPLPDPIPAAVRMRAALKALLRTYRIRAEWGPRVTSTVTSNPKDTDPMRTPTRPIAFVKLDTVRNFLADHPEWREHVTLKPSGKCVIPDARAREALKAYATAGTASQRNRT